MIRSTFAIPAAIAAATLAGLIVALTGDGWADTIAAAVLAIPLLATLWAVTARRS